MEALRAYKPIKAGAIEVNTDDEKKVLDVELIDVAAPVSVEVVESSKRDNVCFMIPGALDSI